MDRGAIRETAGAAEPRGGSRRKRDHGGQRVHPALDSRLGRGCRATSIVPEGVDGQCSRSPISAAYVEDQILYVGWPNYNKGVDVLLRAMALIRDRGEPGRLLLVGGSYFSARVVTSASSSSSPRSWNSAIA